MNDQLAIAILLTVVNDIVKMNNGEVTCAGNSYGIWNNRIPKLPQLICVQEISLKSLRIAAEHMTFAMSMEESDEI